MSTTEDDNNNNHEKFDAAFNRIIEYRKIMQDNVLRKTENQERMHGLLKHVQKTLKNSKIDSLEAGVRDAYDFHSMCVSRTQECGEKIKDIMKVCKNLKLKFFRNLDFLNQVLFYRNLKLVQPRLYMFKSSIIWIITRYKMLEWHSI